MPKPGSLGGIRPLNTLSESFPSRAPNAKRGPSQRPYVDPPAAKRTKTAEYTSARLVLGSDVVEESESVSRTEPCGSHESARAFQHGVVEFRSVENGSRPRSNKRVPRHSVGRRPSASPIFGSRGTHFVRSMDAGHDEIVDDTDVDQLAPVAGVLPRSRPSSSSAMAAPQIKTSRVGGDPSDVQFVKKPENQNRSAHNANSKKQRTPYLVDDDVDELADHSICETKMVSTTPSRNGTRAKGSRRADMSPIQLGGMNGIPVGAAICLDRHRYISHPSDPDSQYYLRPDSKGDLRVVTVDGQYPYGHDWLRITSQSSKLYWSPDSLIVKTLQPRNGKLGIGSHMSLRFSCLEDASWVTNWAGEKLGIPIADQSSEKLARFHEKLAKDITDAIARDRGKNQVLLDVDGLKEEQAEVQKIEFNVQNEAEMTPKMAPASRTRLLRDKMRTSEQSTGLRVTDVLPNGPTTRRSQRARPNGGAPILIEDPPQPPRWTDENTEWMKNWNMPLVFQRTRVEKDDIPRLDEGQCLNDNIIGYGLRYLFDCFSQRAPGLNNRVYLHNTFFYEKLTSDKSYNKKINYDGVKNWTSKVDLLSYDYIIVPVNEHYHWWLAIICNPGRLDPDAPRPSTSNAAEARKGQQESGKESNSDLEVVEGRSFRSPRESAAVGLSRLFIGSPNGLNNANNEVDGGDQEGLVVNLVEDDAFESTAPANTRRPAKRGRKSTGPPPKVYDPQEPRIITLDSLGGGHSPSVTSLKHYLAAEFEFKRQKIIEPLPQQLGMKATNIPEQNNFCDCGVYLLGYMQEFVRDPDKFVQTLLRRDKPAWDLDPQELRQLWRKTIMLEHGKLHGTLESDVSAGVSEPGSATELAKNMSEDNVREDEKIAASPKKSLHAAGIPRGERQATRQCIEGEGADPAPSPLAGSGPNQESDLKEAPLEPFPNNTKLPGSWPSREGSGDEVSLLQPFEDTQPTTQDTDVPMAENKPDCWVSSDGPVKFVSKLAVSPPTKSSQRVRGAGISPETWKIHISPTVAGKRTVIGGDIADSSPPARPPNFITAPVQGLGAQKSPPTIRTPRPKIPTVRAAELVRPSEAIDLTEEDGVI